MSFDLVLKKILVDPMKKTFLSGTFKIQMVQTA